MISYGRKALRPYSINNNQHLTFNFQLLTSNIQNLKCLSYGRKALRPYSKKNFQLSTFNFQHSTSNIQHLNDHRHSHPAARRGCR